MNDLPVIVIGGGVAGLAAALTLASRGVPVVVLEKEKASGGKIRTETVDGDPIDCGPTVFTLPEVFEELFEDAGASFSELVPSSPLEVIARHTWNAGASLDLYSDTERSIDAIGDFAGAAEARRFRDYLARARAIFSTLETSFIHAQRPSPIGLVRAAGLSGVADLWRISPFTPLWSALGKWFQDPRLRQLFGRYATYCGSSPFLAPATLMLVSHVEQAGVFSIKGGMGVLPGAMQAQAESLGAEFRFGDAVREIRLSHGRVRGVICESGDQLEAAAVVCNADPAALSAGYFGESVASAVPRQSASMRSLSAVTFCLKAQTSGFVLDRHNVFFSSDYAAEFKDIIEHQRLPNDPTVYVCAQDRGVETGFKGKDERLFCLVNAPATGDRQPFTEQDIRPCLNRLFDKLNRCGLRVREASREQVTSTPKTFETRYPATGGALYGQASHGWKASFNRPQARTAMPGLYLAGGATHPGPGVPMAAISGRLAAKCVLEDLASRRRFRPTGMPGGI